MSSLAKTRSDASISAARPSSRSSVGRPIDQPLASRTASGPRSGDLVADLVGAAASAWPAGTTRVTRPIRSASCGVDDPAGQDQLLGPRRRRRRAAGAACRRRPASRRGGPRAARASRAPTRRGCRSASASSSPPPSALPSIAAIVGIGSVARRSSTRAPRARARSRPPGPRVRLELLHVASRPRTPVAARRSRRRRGRRRARRPRASPAPRPARRAARASTRFSGGLSSSRWATCAELEVDTRPSRAAAAPRSPRRGPSARLAYTRRSVVAQSLGDARPEAHLRQDVALDVDARRDLDQHEPVVRELEHGPVRDVADLLAALARERAVERDLRGPRARTSAGCPRATTRTPRRRCRAPGPARSACRRS